LSIDNGINNFIDWFLRFVALDAQSGSPVSRGENIPLNKFNSDPIQIMDN